MSIEVNYAAMNRLVMDYLVIEGHKEAAECFMAESGTEVGIDLKTLGERVAIRSAVESGCVAEALKRVKQLGLAVLDNNPYLRFSIMQLAIVELLRSGNTVGALACAQADLAPLIETTPHLLPELERTMLLLAYDNVQESPEAALLSQEHRQEVASALNAAILSAQNQESDAKLPMLLRMLQWEQDELELHHQVSFPRIDDLVDATPRIPPTSNVSHAKSDRDVGHLS